jgi:hypothetical protein
MTQSDPKAAIDRSSEPVGVMAPMTPTSNPAQLARDAIASADAQTIHDARAQLAGLLDAAPEMFGPASGHEAALRRDLAQALDAMDPTTDDNDG